MCLRSAVTQATQNKHPNRPMRQVESSTYTYQLLLVTSVKSQLSAPPTPPPPSFGVGLIHFFDPSNNLGPNEQ